MHRGISQFSIDLPDTDGPKLPFVAGLVAAVQLPQSRPLSLPQHLSASMTAQRRGYVKTRDSS